MSNEYHINWPDSNNVGYVQSASYVQGVTYITAEGADARTMLGHLARCLTHTVSIDAWREGEHVGKCKTCGETVTFKWSHQDVFDLMLKLQKIQNPSQEQIKLLMSAYQVLRHNIEAERRVLAVYESALNITEDGLKSLFTRSEELE